MLSFVYSPTETNEMSKVIKLLSVLYCTCQWNYYSFTKIVEFFSEFRVWFGLVRVR